MSNPICWPMRRRTTTFPAKSVAQLRRSVKFRRAALPSLRRLGSDLVGWGFNGDLLSGLVVGFGLLPDVILIFLEKILHIGPAVIKSTKPSDFFTSYHHIPPKLRRTLLPALQNRNLICVWTNFDFWSRITDTNNFKLLPVPSPTHQKLVRADLKNNLTWIIYIYEHFKYYYLIIHCK